MPPAEVLPVKWTPARSRCESTAFEMSAALPGTKLITPGGRPASSRTRNTYHALSIALEAGFQTTLLPMRAGAPERLPPIAVKLKGETA